MSVHVFILCLMDTLMLYVIQLGGTNCFSSFAQMLLIFCSAQSKNIWTTLSRPAG